MTSLNVTGCRVLTAAVLSMFVFQMTVVAQAEEAERLIYLAKAIKRIVVRQIDKAQPGDDTRAEVQKSFEVKAYDKDGKEVNVSSDQADKLYKWTAKNSSGTSVDQKGVIEQIGSADSKTGQTKNVIKFAMDKGQKGAKLEVRLADQFSSYSGAVGKSSIAMGNGGAGVFKSIGQWIGKHPYWTTAGAVVVGGGVAVAAGGGSSSGSGSGGSLSGTGAETQSGASVTADVTGTWLAAVGNGETLVLYLSQSGASVSGTAEDRPNGVQIAKTGSVSGSVNGNNFSFVVRYSDGEQISKSATVNGNTMIGDSFTATR